MRSLSSIPRLWLLAAAVVFATTMTRGGCVTLIAATTLR